MKLIRYQYPQLPGIRDFDRFFEQAFGDFGRFPLGAGTTAWEPSTDLYEDAANYYARFELPGFSKDQLNLELENAVLTVSGEHKEGDGDDARSRSFSRSVSIPDGVDPDNVSAKFENGLLTVTLPKTAEQQARSITIA